MKKPAPRGPRMLLSELRKGMASYNPRKISEHDAASLRASLQTFGQVQPVIWNTRTRTVVGGHQRIDAMIALGWKDASVEFVDLSPEKERALNLALNRISGEWDQRKLSSMLAELEAGAEKLGGIAGFSAEELARIEKDGHRLGLEIDHARKELRELAADPAGAKVDREADACPKPPSPSNVVSRIGDCWNLDGGHRLVCGNSADPEVIRRACNGVKARLLATDPPYGVDHVEAKKGIKGFSFAARDLHSIANDDLVGDKLRDFLQSVLAACKPHLERAAIYLWHAGLGASVPVIQAAEASDVVLHRQIVWAKPGIVLTRSGWYHWSHEPCFFGWFRGAQPQWFGTLDQRTVWQISHDSERVGHPTQKPVACFLPAIRNHTKRGDLILEPFSGSGTSIIAAVRTGRVCAAVELDPCYVDVAVDRWQRFTGGVATLDGAGATFAEIAKDRRAESGRRRSARKS